MYDTASTIGIDDEDDDYRVVSDSSQLKSDRVQTFIEDAEAAVFGGPGLRLTLSLVRADRTEQQIARYDREGDEPVREWIWSVLERVEGNDAAATLRLRLWDGSEARGGVMFRVTFADGGDRKRPVRDPGASRIEHDGGGCDRCDALTSRLSEVEAKLQELTASLDDAWAALKRAAEARNEGADQGVVTAARAAADSATRSVQRLEGRVAHLGEQQTVTAHALDKLAEIVERRWPRR